MSKDLNRGPVGLGAMGRNRAASSRRAGCQVRGCDVRAAAAQAFAAEGGTVGASPAEAAARCHVIVSAVADPAQTEKVRFPAGRAEASPVPLHRPQHRWV